MTREEEINIAAQCARIDMALQLNHYYTDSIDYIDDIKNKNLPYDEIAEDAFIRGVKWADKTHPSPWISVKDRLPTKGGHYLCMDDNHNIAVLAFVGDKWINTKTFTDVPLEIVKYWMPIPELPKE